MPLNIEIKKVSVSDKKMLKEFVKVPWRAKIYRDDPAWVPYVIRDLMHFCNPEKGYFFENGDGEAQLFIAYLDGKPVGRISAQVYKRYDDKYDRETGFFGFYECIDKLPVSRALFSAAAEWLRAKGKTRMLGPESFASYDSIGFDVMNNGRMPVIGNYHYAYWYEKHALAYGFKKYIDWYCFMVKPIAANMDMMYKIRDELRKKSDVQYTRLTMKEIDKRASELHYILDNAWEGNEGHIPMTEKQFKMHWDELKMVIIPDMAIFAEKDGKTVGFILSVPDANPGIAALNGHLYPWRIVKLLWRLKKSHTLRTILMGVLPEYRGENIDQILILMTIEEALKRGYDESDCSLIVENNHKMIGALKYLNADMYKGYRLYDMKI
ncbi:MAG: GNAT family N-acetyltransferase [Spirochaetes bacterium]|nr:GNAT family N-acetyltransferase [Spirochaetota bacterium]